FVYLGVRPDIMRVKRSWRIQGAFPSRAGDVLVGSALAAARGWRLGQQVALPGAFRGGRFADTGSQAHDTGHATQPTARVSGILAATNGADDQFIYLPLAEAQRLFHRPNKLTHILVRLRDPNDMARSVEALRGCDAGMDM